MAQHAKFAPSAAHRWIPCPGSIRLSEGIDDRPSEYAMEGTILHIVSEQCLREKMGAVEFIGQVHNIEDYQLEIDDEHVEAVQYCVDEVKRISKEYGIKGGMLEVRVNLNDQCWGTVDVLLYNDDYVIVIDFKFGRGTSVEAEGNAQLMIYFLGALKHIHENQLITPIPKKALLIILQPRIPPGTRTWETTVDEIKVWYEKSVKPAFSAAGDPEAVCNPGEEQCRFCPANGVCTARSNYLLGVAEDEFKPFVETEGSDLPMVPDVKPLAADLRGKMDMSLDYMTPANAARVLSFQTDFDNYFKKIGEWAMKQALAGTEIPGMKLVHGKSNRKWIKDNDAVEKLLKKDFEIKNPFTKKVLSPAQAEKKVDKAGKAKLAEHIVKPVGKTILVDETDTRETVGVAVEKDMAEFAEPESVVGQQSEESIDDIVGSLDDDDQDTILLSSITSKPPSKSTKKYQLMELGLKGGVPVSEAAEALFNGNVTQVIRGLRNLNERDGYTVILHSNGLFTVKEAE